MKARPYQLEAERLILKAWDDGLRSILVVMCTGGGKTILFSFIIEKMIKRTGKKVLVLCERRELVEQTAKKVKLVTGLNVSIEMGEYKTETTNDMFSGRASVIVSTIQTQSTGGDGMGRLTKFDPQEFCLVIVDECHHATASTYQRVLNYYKDNAELKILGVTATPDRADEEALGQIFDYVDPNGPAFEYPIYDEPGKPSGIRDGWLVPVVQQFASSSIDLTHIKTVAGELSGAELEAVLKAEKPMQEMIEAIFETMHGLAPLTLKPIDTKDWAEAVSRYTPKRAIAFTRFVNHAKMLSDILNRIQPGFAAYVYGTQEKNERRKIINDYKKGTGAKVICNCNVLGEGYDDDGVRIVFMCCPTKSRARYAQWLGRGTRPLESIVEILNSTTDARRRRFEIEISDKPHVLAIDFAGNSGKHKLVSCADVLGGHISDKAIEALVSKARNHGRPVKMDEELEAEELRQEEKRQREAEEAARKIRLVAKSNYKLQSVDPFDLFQVKPVKETGWNEGKQPTPNMRGFLQKFGFDPAKFNFVQAGQLIGTIKERLDKNLCTPKQALWLKNHGYATDLQFEAASAVMTAWANNGWRRPANLEVGSVCPPRPQKQQAATISNFSAPFEDDSDVPF